MIFLSFTLLMWCTTFVNLHVLDHCCIPRDESYLFTLQNLPNILFASILVMNFVFMFIRDIDLYGSFLLYPFLVLGPTLQRVEFYPLLFLEII